MKILKQTLESVLQVFFKIFFYFFPPKKHDKKLEAAINLYKNGGFGELFALIRAWDAPYLPVNKLIKRDAKIVDFGCGDGLLANYLALSSPKRQVYGIDINKSRISSAFKGIVNTKFEYGDILKVKNLKPDVIILAHVLHHLPNKKAQMSLLERISKNFKKGDEIIILEIDTKPFLKYVFTWLTDAFTVPILFDGKLCDFSFRYRESKEWKNILTKLNFDVRLKKINDGMPFSHVLIYGKKMA